ncbi:MAG: signal recognition particle receptor subunit alpha, partial [Hydrocarboniphaga effusa]|nr:signal recognition particle receptor subunit alpha [Hydrocarboniphaga effusa]
MGESATARLRARINRGDSWLTYDLKRLLHKDGLDEAAIEELETRLLSADAGVEATQFLSDRLRLRLRQGKIKDAPALQSELKSALLELLLPCAQALAIPATIRPFVLLV